MIHQGGPDLTGFCCTVDYNNPSLFSHDLLPALGGTRTRMRFSDHFPGQQKRWLLLAVALVVPGQLAFADSVSSPVFDAEAHAKVCHCGKHCRQAACCCGRHSAAEHEHSAAPPVETRHDDSTRSAPCLEQAPCSDSGLPPTAGPRLQEKAGTLAECASRNALEVSSFLPVRTSCARPQLRPSRIQRPPRTCLSV